MTLTFFLHVICSYAARTTVHLTHDGPCSALCRPCVCGMACMAPGTKFPISLMTSILASFNTINADCHHGRSTSICTRSYTANNGNSWPGHIRTGSQETDSWRNPRWHFGCNDPYDTSVACFLLASDSVLPVWHCCHESMSFSLLSK